MAISSRQIFSDAVEQESDLSVLQLSQSLPALSSSRSSNGSVCPSLTTSNTLSSEGLTELELDAVTPLQSPMFYRAYDVAFRTLVNSSELTHLGDGFDNTTPQAVRVERKTYFPLVGKEPRKQCEAGKDPRAVPKIGQKSELKSAGSGRPSIRAKANRPDSGMTDPADDEPALSIGNPQDAPDELIRSASPQRSAKTNAILTSNAQSVSSASELSPRTDHQESQMMERCVGPRLGLSPTWFGECPLPTEAHSVDQSTPASHTLRDDVDHEPKSPEKVVLQPIDAALTFVQTPSPMDELPPSDFFRLQA